MAQCLLKTDASAIIEFQCLVISCAEQLSFCRLHASVYNVVNPVSVWPTAIHLGLSNASIRKVKFTCMSSNNEQALTTAM